MREYFSSLISVQSWEYRDRRTPGVCHTSGCVENQFRDHKSYKKLVNSNNVFKNMVMSRQKVIIDYMYLFTAEYSSFLNSFLTWQSRGQCNL